MSADPADSTETAHTGGPARLAGLRWPLGHNAAVTARRRLSVLAVIVLAVIPAAVVLIASLAGDRERMVSYFEVASVDADGHATVDEVIDYDFGAGSERHGIYRIVPGLTDSSAISVSSPDAPDQVQITGGNIRIGDPDVTVSGSHRYQISYGLDTLTAGDRLAWNIVGTEWDVTIESVEAHVISARELSDVSCDQGPFGTEGGCDAVETEPGHLVVRTGPISSGQAVTVRATLGAPLAAVATAPAVPAEPADTGAPLARPFLFGFLAAAVAGLVTGRILRRAGREYAPAGYQGIAPGTAPVPPGVESPFAPLPGDATRVDAADLVADAPPQVALPRTLTAAQGGVVLAEKVQASHQAAWLLGQAQHGAIALEGDPKKPTMRWLGGHGGADNAALLTMFHSRPTVELGTYDPDFASGWKMVGAELDAWRTTSGLWSDQAERRRKWVIALGVLVVIVGLVVGRVGRLRVVAVPTRGVAARPALGALGCWSGHGAAGVGAAGPHAGRLGALRPGRGVPPPPGRRPGRRRRPCRRRRPHRRLPGLGGGAGGVEGVDQGGRGVVGAPRHGLRPVVPLHRRRPALVDHRRGHHPLVQRRRWRRRGRRWRWRWRRLLVTRASIAEVAASPLAAISLQRGT